MFEKAPALFKGIGGVSESRQMKKAAEIEKGLDNNMPIDMVEIDIKNMWSILGEIIGETYQDELINQLFSQFCLGK